MTVALVILETMVECKKLKFLILILAFLALMDLLDHEQFSYIAAKETWSANCLDFKPDGMDPDQDHSK